MVVPAEQLVLTYMITVTDVDGTTATHPVVITITGTNDAPIVTSVQDPEVGPEDNSLTGQVNVSDVDNGDGDLIYSLGTPPEHGEVIFTIVDGIYTGEYTYIPDLNYNGGDTFTVVVTDGSSDPSDATKPIVITITAVADAPVAYDDYYDVNEDGTLTKDDLTGVLSNDNDDADDPTPNIISAELMSDPSHAAPEGFTFNSDGSFTYEPAEDYHGSDSFTYRVTDNGIDNNIGNTVTVYLTVKSVNDAPSAVGDSYEVDEDGQLIVSIIDSVLINDTDSSDGSAPYSHLTAVLVSGPTHATATPESFSFFSDGTFTYTPDPDYNGPDSFTYYVTDGEDINSDSSTVTVNLTVKPISDAPVGTDDSYDIDEDGILTVLAADGVLKNDDDPSDTPSDTPLKAMIVGDVSYGKLTLNVDGSFTYEPDVNYSGSDSFTYRLTDSGTDGGSSDGGVYTVNLTINPIADAPNLTISNQTSSLSSETVDLTAPSTIIAEADGHTVTITDVPLGSTITSLVGGNEVSWTEDPDNPGTWSYDFSVGDNWDGNLQIGGDDNAGTDFTINYNVSYTILGGTYLVVDDSYYGGHNDFMFTEDVFDHVDDTEASPGYETGNQSGDILTVKLGSFTGNSSIVHSDLSGGFTFKNAVGVGTTSSDPDGFYIGASGTLSVSVDVIITMQGTESQQNEIHFRLVDSSGNYLTTITMLPKVGETPDADGFLTYTADVPVLVAGTYNIYIGGYLSGIDTDNNIDGTKIDLRNIVINHTVVTQDVDLNINEPENVSIAGVTDYSVDLSQSLVDQGGTETLDVITVISGLPVGTMVGDIEVTDGTWTNLVDGPFNFSVPVDTGDFALIFEANSTVGGTDTASTITVVEFGDDTSSPVGATVTGGDGNDNLIGAAGDDILDGGAGDDTITGNAGNDTFVLSEGSDIISDFIQGEDSLDIGDLLAVDSPLAMALSTEEGSNDVMINFDTNGDGVVDGLDNGTVTLEGVLGGDGAVSTSLTTDNYTNSGDLNTALDNLLTDTLVI